MSCKTELQVWLVSTDLLLYSQLAGSAQQVGITVVTQPDESAALRAIAVDLASIDSVADRVSEFRNRFGGGVTIWAFGPHVHTARLAEARAAGCDLVTSRGDFVQRARERFASLVTDENF